jgi:hypothetical protein
MEARPMTKILAVAILALAFPLPAAARELPRPGGALPFASTDGNCPSGYYRSGSFCAPVSRDSRPAVARPPGASCPSGWYTSGSGCVQLNR